MTYTVEAFKNGELIDIAVVKAKTETEALNAYLGTLENKDSITVKIKEDSNGDLWAKMFGI